MASVKRRVKTQAPTCIAPALGDTRGSAKHREGTQPSQVGGGIRSARVFQLVWFSRQPRKLVGFHLHSSFVGLFGSRFVRKRAKASSSGKAARKCFEAPPSSSLPMSSARKRHRLGGTKANAKRQTSERMRIRNIPVDWCPCVVRSVAEVEKLRWAPGSRRVLSREARSCTGTLGRSKPRRLTDDANREIERTQESVWWRQNHEAFSARR